MTSLASPNTIIWRYFAALRRLVIGIEHEQDESVIKENVALCVMLAVTVDEAFLNCFFRVVIGEQGFAKNEGLILKDLKKRKSLNYKLDTWPEMVFGKALDFDAPTPKAFRALMYGRNDLIHFTSSHTTVNLPDGVILHGLVDISVFDALTVADAVCALDLAEGMVRELFLLRGIPERELPHALHSRTGKVPI